MARHARLPRAGRDLGDDLAREALAVEPPLAGDDRAAAPASARRTRARRARTAAPGDQLGAERGPQPAGEPAGGAGHRHAPRVGRAGGERLQALRQPPDRPSDRRPSGARTRAPRPRTACARRTARAAGRRAGRRARAIASIAPDAAVGGRAAAGADADVLRSGVDRRRRSARRCPALDASASRSAGATSVQAAGGGRLDDAPSATVAQQREAAASIGRPSGSLTRPPDQLAAERSAQRVERALAAVGHRARIERDARRARGPRRSPRRPRGALSVPLKESGATSTVSDAHGPSCGILPARWRRRRARSADRGRRARRSASPTRARCSSPSSGSRSSTSSTTTSSCADAGRCSHLRDRPTALKRWVDGVAGEPFFQKRIPDTAPEWLQTATVTFPSGRCGARARRQRRRPPRLGRQPRRDRLEPVAGRAAATSTTPTSCASTSTRRPRRLGRRSRGRGLSSREVLDRPRPDRLSEDLRLARDPRQRPHPARARLHRGAPRRAGARPRGRAARCPELRHEQVVEGGARRRVRRLQPERARPHRRVGLLVRAVPGRSRVDCPLRLGRARRRRARRAAARHRPGAAARARRSERRHRRRTPARSTACSSSPRATRRTASATRRGRRTSASSPARPRRVQPSRARPE